MSTYSAYPKDQAGLSQLSQDPEKPLVLLKYTHMKQEMECQMGLGILEHWNRDPGFTDVIHCLEGEASPWAPPIPPPTLPPCWQLPLEVVNGGRVLGGHPGLPVQRNKASLSESLLIPWVLHYFRTEKIQTLSEKQSPGIF